MASQMMSLATLAVMACMLIGTSHAAVAPQYRFADADSAAKWGSEVQALQKAYENTADPEAQKAAKANVDAIAADFQKHYEARWGTDASAKLAAFTANLWKIGDINVGAPKTGWWAALTEYSDRTFEQFTSEKLMKVGTPPTLGKYFDIIFKISETVDWDAKNKVTAIKNQKSCGSCWAFAASAALESRYLIKKGLLASSATNIDLAEQQLVDCVKSPRTSTTGAAYNSGGCSGGWSQEAMDYVRKYNVTFEPNYPYTATNGVCKQKALTATGAVAPALKQDVPDPGYYVVPPANLTAWKNAIQYTPAVFYFRVESPFQFYSGGVFSTSCASTNINHAMLIYGYYTSILPGTTPYWMVKNSWGTGWGVGGKAKILLQNSGNGLCTGQKYAYIPNDNSIIVSGASLAGRRMLSD